MDISSPAAFVNGELLKMYVGRRVRTLVQVMRVDGGVLMGQAPDGNPISIKAFPAISPSKFVEVIGVADSGQSIRSEICTNFGDAVDLSDYNRVCQLANSELKSLFL